MWDLASFLRLDGFLRPAVNGDSCPSTSPSPLFALSSPPESSSPDVPTLDMDSSPPSLESPSHSPRVFSLRTFFALQTSPFLPASKNLGPPSPIVSPPPEPPSVAYVSPPPGSSPGIQKAQSTLTANSKASSPAQINPVVETAPHLLQMNSSSSFPNSVVPSKEPPYRIDGDSYGQELIGITLAGLAIISLVAFIFAIIRKNRNKRTDIFVHHDGTGPSNFSVKSDGRYRHTPYMGSSSHPYPKPQKIPSTSESNYASHGGNGFHSGLAGSVATENSKFHSGLASSVPTENSKIHSGFADSAAMRSSRIYSGPAESSLIRYPKFHPGLADPGAIGNSKPWFTFDELIDITDGFSPRNFLGEGGFGPVYKGQLQDGREVAVKELKVGSGQGEREFKAEVEIISRVHHRHLVSLVGYCIAEQHRLLVYEFVPNNTLEHHLHGKGMPTLDWSKRVKIAIGAAKGLAYLHEDCHPRIIHRDIKSANILLDNSFEAQVADFGLAKPSHEAFSHVSTRVMGTVGYLAPEYASSGKLTDRSDVFSFGVVLLELVTGRKPVDPSQPFGEESLIDWARPLLIRAIETRDLRELLDLKLGNNYVESEVFNMIEIAAVCLCHSAPKRPRMVQVARALDSEGSMSDLSSRVKDSQSPAYGAGQYPPDIQRFRQMGFISGQHSPAYGTSREYEPKISGYSGQYHPRESPQRALRKGRDYGFDYGASGDYHLRESPHSPLRTPKGSDFGYDYGTSREHGSDSGTSRERERKNYPQNGENHVRKAPPRPQKSRKGSSDYSSGHGSSRDYERRTASLNEEHQSRELPHRTNSLDIEAPDSSRRGSDRGSGGIPANFGSGRFDRR